MTTTDPATERPTDTWAVTVVTATDLRYATGTLSETAAHVRIGGCTVMHHDPAGLAETLIRLGHDLLTAAGEREQTASELALERERGLALARESLADGASASNAQVTDAEHEAFLTSQAGR